MEQKRYSRRELLEEIYYSVPGCFDIDFSKGFSTGGGKAKFYPFLHEDQFVNDSNYKDQICMMNSDLEEDDWIESDEIEADGYCVLTLEETTKQEITFHEEISATAARWRNTAITGILIGNANTYPCAGSLRTLRNHLENIRA